MDVVNVTGLSAASDLPWYRQVSSEQWRAFWATFIGWVVDAFDFNILSFIILDIQRSFTVNSGLAGLLATVTLLMRLVGGVVAGTAADRWGRKLPMMLSMPERISLPIWALVALLPLIVAAAVVPDRSSVSTPLPPT